MSVQPSPPQPEFVELHAPGEWTCIDFVSDLHLAHDTPHTFAAWAGYMARTRAQAVFILGDLFEAWTGDDSRHEPFESGCVNVLRSTTASRWVGFMRGNRDFLVGAEMLEDSGVAFLTDPTLLIALGHRIVLSHGDELCLGDTDYQTFRREVRSSAWQAAFLERPLAERRVLARALRDGSEQRKTLTPNGADWVDLDYEAMLEWLTQASAPVLVHGHTHRPADEKLDGHRSRRVLSDWDFDYAGSRPRGDVLRLTGNGFERIDAGAADH